MIFISLRPYALALLLGCTAVSAQTSDQPGVKIETPNLHGSRQLEPQTNTAVTRDYLESWDTLASALEDNRADGLSASFTGTALDRLKATVADQTRMGIHTRYTAHSHDLQIIFYSPEGGSIQLIDTVEYEQQVMDHDNKVLATMPVTRRYLVVMTPSEVRWRVRFFQAEPGNASGSAS